MAYYLLVRYYSNKGYILDNPHYYSGGVTSYSSVTASSSSSYKYFKTDSTRTNQTSTVIKGATTSSGTYGNVGNRYTASSSSTVCNLTDVSTFGLTRDGYHIDANQAYKSSDGSKVYGQNGSSAPSANRATISRLGGSTSANKTVSIYVNWIGNSYTINYSANGGSFPDTAPATSATYDSNVTFSSITPTRTGYTFLGWSSSSTATSATWTAGETSTSAPNLTSTNNSAVTVYAVWQANTYTVTLNPNGGSYSGSSSNTAKTMTYNTGNNASIGAPVRVGYNFLGWYDASSGGNQGWDENGDAVSGTYWTEGGTGTWSVKVHDREGWLAYSNYIGTDGNDLYVVNYPLSTSTTVRKYDITDWSYTTLNNFDSTALTYYNSYTGMTPEPSNRGSCSYFVNLQGRTFGIEYYDTGREDDYSNADIKEWFSGKTWQYLNSQTFYAHWEDTAPVITILSTSVSSSNYYAAVTFKIVDGSTIIGYYIGPSNSPTSYRSVSSTSLETSDSVTASPTYIVAKDTAGHISYVSLSIYQLTANANGGSMSTSTGWYKIDSNTSVKYIPYNAAYTVLPSAPTRSGYTFDGWYTAASGGSQVSTDTVMGSADTVIYAHWTRTAPSPYIKVNGTWKTSLPYIKVDGTWKEVATMYVKVNGTWKQVT